jgi:uncharacterized membrane protein
LLGAGSAYQRLSHTLPANRMVILPAPAPGKQLLPFMTPDALYAMCRYEIRNAQLSVSAVLPEAGWALSLHTPQGDNFYVMPAQQTRGGEVSFVVVPGGERLSDIGPAGRGTAAVENQVASPSSEGLVIVRAPLKGLAWRAETEALLRHAKCMALRQQ